jgi:hypothetical protein
MCEECENKIQEIELPKMRFDNCTDEELTRAFMEGNRRSYTPDEVAWFYNLYNRVFKQNKQPGCGKCFVNIRRQLSEYAQHHLSL